MTIVPLATEQHLLRKPCICIASWSWRVSIGCLEFARRYLLTAAEIPCEVLLDLIPNGADPVVDWSFSLSLA